MAEYLGNAGYHVCVANSGAEAKRAVMERRFSLVITDLRMETGRDEDGLDFVRYVREHRPGLPVFVLTASGSPEAATEGVRLQVNRFLGKPVALSGLLATVQEFVDEFYRLPA